MIRNPFQSADGAGRYAAGRPYLHPLFMERLGPLLSANTLGADVACGTGLGSVALAEVVERVLAYDASAAMLAQGLHWFDRPRFFAEVRRTLKPEGVLFVYDMEFAAQLQEQPEFTDWMHQHYGVRYPPPPRGSSSLNADEVQGAGFSFHEERFDHWQPFTRAELVAYLLTHSNTIAASDEGRETPEEIAAWLGGKLERFLPGEAVGQLAFGGLLRMLKLV
ncbi:class I SAM-dependent methyltransferase [Deinococcus sp.]|uniref:class I SAM-dependent methyltransferase n=1 Tax=Deinococcus sp. TaxID=47478 RepID=UPI003CC558F5